MTDDPSNSNDKPESDEPQTVEITAKTLWGAVEQLFSHYYNGILVRGLVLLDVYDTEGTRQFDWEGPDDTAPWDARGLCLEAVNDINRISTAVTVLNMIEDMHDDEDEEADDDE